MEDANISSVIFKVETELYKQGMSKGEFYRKSGVSKSAYSQWLSGRRKPTQRSVKAMADALGVPVEYLLEPEGEVVAPFDHWKQYETGIADDGKVLTFAEILSSLETLGTYQLIAIKQTADALIQERGGGVFTDPDSLRAQREGK